MYYVFLIYVIEMFCLQRSTIDCLYAMLAANSAWILLFYNFIWNCISLLAQKSFRKSIESFLGMKFDDSVFT